MNISNIYFILNYMITYLNIIKGPLKGFRFKARAGITIGGPESHINLKDDSILNTHARLVKDSNSQLLIAAESSNKAIYVNNKRIKQTLLEKDQEIKIGASVLLVSLKKSKIAAKQPTHSNKWLDIIKNKYQEFSSIMPDKPINLSIMNPMVNLHFIKGLQIQTDWTLGYGPRIIGPSSTDLKIFEPTAPDICFELIPIKDGVLFQTDHKKTVTINNKKIKSKVIKDGDVINILNTEILVSLVK